MKNKKLIGLLVCVALATGCGERTPPDLKGKPAIDIAKNKEPIADTLATLGVRLGQGSVAEKVEAARQLSQRGAEAAPILADALGDGDWKIRYAAADALKRLGASATPAGPALTKALKDWVPVLQATGRFKVRKKTGLSSAGWGLPGDEDLAACLAVVTAIGQIGPNAADAIPMLDELVKNDYHFISDEALEALDKMGPDATAALIKAYERAFDNESPFFAGEKLEKMIGKRGLKATPHLAKAVAECKSNEMRIRLIEQMPHDVSTVPVLIDLLQGKDRIAASKAAFLLAGYGKNAQEITPRLIAALKKEQARDPKAFPTDPEFHEVALRIYPAPELPTSGDTDIPIGRAVSFRELLIRALGSMGKEAREALPLLSVGLKDEDQNVRAAAQESLKRIGGDKKS